MSVEKLPFYDGAKAEWIRFKQRPKKRKTVKIKLMTLNLVHNNNIYLIPILHPNHRSLLVPLLSFR